MDSRPLIKINLDRVGHTDTDPRGDGFIQREARSRVLRALAEPVAPPLDDATDSDRPEALNVLGERRHGAIVVSARRGEGKTTFLTSILTTIQTRTYRDLLAEDDPGIKSPRLFSLGIIDPTLIETKQNIVIVIIDRIRLATEHRRKRSGGPDDYAAVETSLRRLAQGLSLLDGIGEPLYANRDWLDADYVLDRGLEDASAAHDFERRFRKFVREAARYLDCDAFVLAIDDVDTWFERGWPVLEAIRKYMATPQLRVILSGDLNLYSLLVRRQQWGQMSDDFLRAESMRGENEPGASRLREIGRMVDALEDQYLIKVAPPENRVDLRRLIWHAEAGDLQLTAAALEGVMPVQAFIRILADRLLGVRANADVDLIRRQLLQLPVRSALQVLAGSVRLCAAPNATSNERRVAVDTLRHVAWTSLMANGLDPDHTRDPAPDTILGVLSEWLTRERHWMTLSRLHPNAVDDDGRNVVAIFLTAVLHDIFRISPGRMVDYWLRISVIREKIDRGEILQQGRPALAALFKHLNAGALESSLQFVSRLAAWEATEGGRERTRRTIADIRLSGASVPLSRIRERGAAARELYGVDYKVDRHGGLDREIFRTLKNRPDTELSLVINALPPPLRGYHLALLRAGWSYSSRRGKEAGFQVYFANGIEDLSDRLDRDARLVARIPIHRIVSGQQSESGSYSFLRLLSVIGELMDLVSSPSDQRLAGITRIIDAATQVRSYPTPAAAQDARPGPASEYDDDDEGLEGNSDFDPFAAHLDDRIEQVLERWLAHHAVTDARALAPVTLSRMWTRFTYAFHNMRDELSHGESRYLGVLFHRSAIVFLHAVGFEAIRSANFETRRSLANNPVKSGEVFARLLDEIYLSDSGRVFREMPEFRFFDFLFSCPLWAYFLAREEGDEVTEPRRGEPNDSIFQHYADRSRDFWLESEGRLEPAQVLLRSPKGEDPAYFGGLFLPLNTVQLQGQADFGARAGAKLNAAMLRLRPRDRRRGNAGPPEPELDEDI